MKNLLAAVLTLSAVATISTPAFSVTTISNSVDSKLNTTKIINHGNDLISLASAQVDGRNVTRVNFQSGYYRDLGSGMWGEFNVNDNQVFTFQETQRDDWSVYSSPKSVVKYIESITAL